MHWDYPKAPPMNESPAPAAASFRRQLRSRISDFDALVQALTAWAMEAGVPRATMGSVVLILDELFANIVAHGYRNDPDGQVVVQAQVADGALQVTLADQAPAFDPVHAPEPDTTLSIEDRRIGGLGLLFVRRTADTLSRASPDPTQPQVGNVVRFSKKLRG